MWLKMKTSLYFAISGIFFLKRCLTWTHYVDQVDLEITDICLSLPSGTKGMEPSRSVMTSFFIFFKDSFILKSWFLFLGFHHFILDRSGIFLKSWFFKNYFYMCMSVLPACMPGHNVHVVTWEVRRGYQVSRDWSYGCFVSCLLC